MSLILNIDTSGETASVSIASEGVIKNFLLNSVQKEHATFLHSAIATLTNESGIDFHQLSAIAVTEGPGSYTGIRVGMATAKGLSFALGIPLITISTLDAMAHSFMSGKREEKVFYAPMIDARRSEVFMIIYNEIMKVKIPASAIILNETSFSELLENNRIFFFGSGAEKFSLMTKSPNAIFSKVDEIHTSIGQLSADKYKMQIFSNLIASQPLYIKEFFNG